MDLIHTWLPRGGRVGRVLPAVVADTAKAEGVAFGVAGIFPVAGSRPYGRTAKVAQRGQSLRPRATPPVSRLRREPARRRRSRGREGAFCCVAGTARRDKKFSAEQESPTTWILG